MRLGFHLLTNANYTVIIKALPNDFQSLKRKLDSIDEVVRSMEASRCSALYTFQFSIHLHSLDSQRKVMVDVYISGATNAIYESFLNSLELEEPNSLIVQVSPFAKNLPSEFKFIWGPENEALQMDKCVAWLSSIISIPRENKFCQLLTKMTC